MKIPAAKIKEYLNGYSGFLVTRNKAELILEQDDSVIVTLPIEAGRSRNIMIDLVVNFKSIDEFIEKAGIGRIDDLHRIKSSVCWAEYVFGKAYISCMVEWLNMASICFRKTEAHFTHWEERLPGTAMTMVYSTDLHYYAEVHKALTLPEQFIEYIESKMELLKAYDKLRPANERGGFVEIKVQDS